MKTTFSRKERLRSNTVIRALFAGKQTFFEYPFRVTWKFTDSKEDSPAQVLMTVPKYNFRKAVDRNLLRRRMKEAYRLNKHLLYNELAKNARKMAFCITFTAKEILPFDLIQQKIILILHRLNKEIEKVTG